MLEEILIGGFGGQGVLFMGQFIAYTGLYEGKEVSWYPSYGAEMRGGTANCTVIISTNLITSVILDEFDTVIALNKPSMEKFEQNVKKEGLIVFNSSQTKDGPQRSDISFYSVEGEKIAQDAGNIKTVNMVMMGAYFGLKKLFKIESAMKTLKFMFSSKGRSIMASNEYALLRGYDLTKDL